MVGTINTKVMALVALFALAIAFAPVAWAGNAGDAGLLSLRMGIGAREAAMGETGVATSTGGAAVFWNPANNVFAAKKTDLVLQHHRYLGLFNHESAAVATPVGKGVLGFIFMGFYSDSIDRYGSEPVGVPEGTFKPYDVALGVSYAYPLGDSFAVAMNVKMIYEKIDIYSDTGFAFDFFLTLNLFLNQSDRWARFLCPPQLQGFFVESWFGFVFESGWSECFTGYPEYLVQFHPGYPFPSWIS